MSLSRVKSWVVEVLTASDLNAEFNNILNYLNGSGVTLTSPVLTTPTVSGTLTAQGLIDASGAAAGQIKFPATQVASANANTLDDYEEGSWNPTLGGTTTYTTQAGSYTKIGRLVYYHGQLVINVMGTGSATTIDGLPFTVVAPSRMAATIYFTGIVTAVTSLAAYAVSGTTTITFACLTAAATSVTNTPNVFQGATSVLISGVYETA